jgi:NagD protein
VDGTLVLSEDPNTGAGAARPLPGAAELLRTLRQRGVRYACFTNGTGQLPPAIAAKLRGVGLDVADSDVLTPATVAAEHIRRTYPGEPVLAFGTSGVLEPLREMDIHLLPVEEAERAKVVLIGADPDFTYVKLTAACRAVWNGAPMLVTSMAPYFASAVGRLPSTSGAIAAGIRHVTGAEPLFVGKPSPLVLQVAAQRLKSAPSALVVIGDDIRLEVRMAREADAFSVLVLSGSTHADQVKKTPEELRPHVVLQNVGEMLSYI